MNSRKAFTSTIDRTLSTYLVTLASLHSLYQSQKHKNKSDLVKCQAINLTLTFFFWTYFFSNFCLVLNYPTQRIHQASDLLSLSLFCYCRQVTISQFFFREEGRSVLNLPHHQVGANPNNIMEGVDLVLNLPNQQGGAQNSQSINFRNKGWKRTI